MILQARLITLIDQHWTQLKGVHIIERLNNILLNLKKFLPLLQYAAQAKLMSSHCFYHVSKSSRNREKRDR